MIIEMVLKYFGVMGKRLLRDNYILHSSCYDINNYSITVKYKVKSMMYLFGCKGKKTVKILL